MGLLKPAINQTAEKASQNFELPCRVKMTDREYHRERTDFIGSSGLKTILRSSPMHFKYEQENPPEPTPAMILGSAAHAYILEPHMFERDYAVKRKVDGRTKEGKEYNDKFAADNAGKVILSEEQVDHIEGMRTAVYSHPTASKLLTYGHPETAFLWEDIETGVKCKVKPDFLREGHIIVDVKTTADAGKDFMKQAANLMYHVSAGMYLEGVSTVTGQNYNTFVIVAVENKPPYAVSVYVYDEPTLEQGIRQFKRALNIYAECIRTNTWPGYIDGIRPLSLPMWAVEFEA